MAREERHPLAPAADQAGLPAAAATGPGAGAAPLDKLVRALDQAVIRSAQTGYGCSNPGP